MSSQIPSKCKAMVAEKKGEDLVLKDVPVQKPEQGQILIKTLACGVCHSDDAVREGLFGDVFPRVPGHEIVGEVVALGPGEKKWKIGDRVGGGWHGGQDGTCKQCFRGRFQYCENNTINGVMRDGGYSEYCVLRSEATVRLSKELDPAETAPLLCAGVTLFNSVRNQNIIPGDIIAVQGLGGLGHLGIQYVRKMGFRTVALSSTANKRDFAFKLGANDFLHSDEKPHSQGLKEMGGAALIVVTAPNPDVVSDLLNGLAPGGKLLILAPVGDVKVNTITMITNNISVLGFASGHALDSEEAVEFAQYHDVHCMIEKMKLEEANKALEKMRTGSVRFRSVLVF